VFLSPLSESADPTERVRPRGDKLEIIAQTYSARSTDKFGPDLVDRAVTTLTYVVGDETKAIAAIFAL
jgi:acyl-ACP thioesterase